MEIVVTVLQLVLVVVVIMFIYDMWRFIAVIFTGRGVTPTTGRSSSEPKPGFLARVFGMTPEALSEESERATADAERLTEIQRRLEESQESAENLAAQMDAMDASDIPAINDIRRQLEILTQDVEHLTQMRDRLRRGR